MNIGIPLNQAAAYSTDEFLDAFKKYYFFQTDLFFLKLEN